MTRKKSPQHRDSTGIELGKRAEELERLRGFVEERLASADNETVGELRGVDHHPADTVDFQLQRGLQQTTREILEGEALQVRKALERRAAGQYGICDECGKPISLARLAARPEATLCIDCQRKREESRASERHHDGAMHREVA